MNPSEFEEVVVGCFKQCCTQVRRELRVKRKGEIRVGGGGGGEEGGIEGRRKEESEEGRGSRRKRQTVYSSQKVQ